MSFGSNSLSLVISSLGPGQESVLDFTEAKDGDDSLT